MRLDMPLVNPVDHGATVDDDDDDTDALRASVDALPDDGGVILFPAGTLRKHLQQWPIRNSTDPAQLPGLRPTLGDVEIQDTEILKTRDVSFVIPSLRDGLFRIHLRRAKSESSLESRFEYVARGTEDSLCAWLGRLSGLVHSVETRTVGSESYTLLLSEVALELPLELSGVTFDELRAGDRDGTLTSLGG